jgi:hypothetical protein
MLFVIIPDRRLPSRLALTLIELLAAMRLPALARARMKAGGIQWMNTRAIMVALTRINLAAHGLLLGLIFLICVPAKAQNLLKNPEFESPLGATNWTVGHIRGGLPDFEIHDRTTAASRGWDTGDFGAQFRPFHNKLAHAYFTQTVTNLTPGHSYLVSGWMSEDWWSAPSGTNAYDPIANGVRDRFLVYIEAIGGLGSATSDGRFSLKATNASPAYTNADVAVYATSAWGQYSVRQTPDTNGRIEVRLHLDKRSWELTYYLYVMNGYFDSISLTP